MTREARYDFKLNLGNGFPNDRAFMLQMMTDFAKLTFPDGPAITRNEMRRFMREQVGMDLDDENDQSMQPPQMAEGMPPPMGAVPPGSAPMPQPAPQIPPELIAALQGGVM
jgi:hypothetical protein